MRAPFTRALARPLNGWDLVKLIALLLMFIDHAGYFFFPGQQWLRAIGRGAAPVFLFLGGYAASYGFKPHLLVLALLLDASNDLITGGLHPLNILFPILFCRMLFDFLERGGKTIRRPLEWYISSLVWMPLMLVMQYGSMSLLFAICGYMKKATPRYAPATRRLFWRLTFATYVGVESFWFQFSLANTALTALTLTGIYQLLNRFTLEPVATGQLPAWLLSGAKLVSACSGYIYVAHLIALIWLTGRPG